MNGVRQSRRRLVLAALGGVLAIMAVGAGIALAVSQGTAGELNYQRTDAFVDGGGFKTVKARCPRTRHVTGGGYDAPSDTETTLSEPYDSGDNGTVPDDGWKANFHNLAGGAAHVAVTAICDD